MSRSGRPWAPFAERIVESGEARTVVGKQSELAALTKRVLRRNRGGSTRDGAFIPTWGGSGNDDGQFIIPHGIALDGRGQLFVADNGNARIQVFTDGGLFSDKWGLRGSGSGEFGNDSPTDVAVNVFGEIFVVDRVNCWVQKFAEPPTGAIRSSWGRVKATYSN